MSPSVAAAWFVARFRAGLQYRAAAWAGVSTQLVFGFARVMIVLAFFRAGSADQPMTAAQAVSYIWLGQLFLRLMPWGLEELDAEVRTGQIAYNLLKPTSLLGQYFVRSLAACAAAVTLRALPMLPVTMLLPGAYRLLPPTPLGGLMFAVTILGAAVLSSAINCVLAMVCFRSVTGDGIRLMVRTLTMLLAGNILPVPLLPDGLQTLLFLNPFAGLSDLPCRLWTGALAPAMGPVVLALQLGWTVVCLGLAHWVMTRNLRSLCILGG